MKEKSLMYQWVVPGLILLAIAGAIIFEQSQKDKALAGLPSIASAIIFATGEPHAAAFAPVYLSNSTTTAEFNTEGADILNLELYSSVASTTADTIGISVEFSDNGTNWFTEDVNSTSGRTTTHQGRTRAWTPGATASTTMTLQLTNINSKYIRIGAASWGINHTATSSDFAFWARYILNKPF